MCIKIYTIQVNRKKLDKLYNMLVIESISNEFIFEAHSFDIFLTQLNTQNEEISNEKYVLHSCWLGS